MIRIRDGIVDLDDFFHASMKAGKLEVDSNIYSTLELARKTVDRLASGKEPVYGLNTGLGGNLGYRLKPEEIPDFQMQILRGRAVACGDILSEEIGRAVLLARIVSAAKGYSGISIEMFDHICCIYRSGLAPAIHEYGSIGAGDLTQNSDMALAIMGEGSVWKDGKVVPSRTAFESLGIELPEIQPKDAMVLINHSGLSVALSGMALRQAKTALHMTKASAVLSYEGYGANREILAEELNQLRHSPMQSECAAWFRNMLEGAEDNPRRVQEALSFRTIAPAFGAAENSISDAIGIWKGEANGSSDNPAVLTSGEMRSTPNFHSPALALALENASIAIAGIAAGSVQRMQKMMDPDLSGLPRYLSPVGKGSAGFVPAQKTAVALLSEIRHFALPVALEPAPVSDTVEDVAPLTPQTATKLSHQSKPMKLLAGLEALVACQALDLRKPEKCGNLSRKLWPEIRKSVPMLKIDRAIGNDIELVAGCLEYNV
ncbi:MAG: aromatic amino acid ammonia-lyase [Rhizobiaceae bacterium]